MAVRKIIQIDEEKCTGCGQCVTTCAEGALEIIDGKARVIKDSFCDGLGACIGECPEGALKIVERDVDEFDEKAVKHHLKEKEMKMHTEKCGCPSATPMTMEKKHHMHEHTGEQEAKLGHWPIQLTLVQDTAPFLQGKDLIVLADCAAVAYGNIQNKFIDGNSIVMCCPKLDDIEPYERKLRNMVQNAGLKSISVVNMEVPCCFGLDRLVKKVLSDTHSKLPYKQYIIGIRGDLKN